MMTSRRNSIQPDPLAQAGNEHRDGFASRLRSILERVKTGEEGASIIEMAIACSVLLTLLIGIVQVSQALYVYNYASEAAREGTRYAAVRGANSCTNATNSMTNCNLGPTSAGNPIQTYLQGLGFPYSSGLTATATWLAPTGGSPNQWNISCTTATDTNTLSALKGDACNYPGHAVQVQVTYSYPLAIPVWGVHSINIVSTSQMVIND